MRKAQTIAGAVILACATGGLARAQAVAPAGHPGSPDRVLIVRTTEDPAVPSMPAGCPFDTPNVLLGATVWSFQTEAAGSEVVNPDARQVGTAAACGKITTPLVPFVQVPFYIEFNLQEGVVAAQGVCTVTSNNVPAAGLILAGCALNVIGAPPGIAGGNATSNSVFNPRGLPGFNTGSYWTLRLYRS